MRKAASANIDPVIIKPPHDVPGNGPDNNLAYPAWRHVAVGSQVGGVHVVE